jgi:MOSC domain-containing protein YiiM
VITTLAQCGLPEDIEILRATARHNKVIAGIRLSVLTPGPVAVGDPITLLEERPDQGGGAVGSAEG